MIILSGYGWVRFLADHVHATRKLRYAALQVGDELEENICLQNKGWLPALWIGIADHSDFLAYSIGVIRALDSSDKAEWRVNLICKQRGVFSLGPWEWVSGDPFGLFTVRRSYSKAQKMVVYPPLAVLPDEFLPKGKQVGDVRPLNQPWISDSVQATQTRPYQPGDPLRRIHWRTTARHQTPYVKIFDPEAASRIWLIPDLDPVVHSKNQSEDWQDSTEETMILLLSALASQLINNQRAVGLFAGVDPACILLPQRGPAFLWTILSELAPLHTTQPVNLEETLKSTRNLISARDLVIVVTPSLESDWMFNLAQMTHSFGGSEAWAFILDPTSFGMDGNPKAVQAQAAAKGINTRIVRRGDIQPQLGGLGSLRRWEYLTLGTGRVVVRNRPRLAEDLEAIEVGKWV
ncbi:MAG: DUF58 domain-containing protein [Anaerolineaceae bacterium]|nr:DUF58 domain-containing protein [Anaerolineaceae bacterium]